MNHMRCSIMNHKCYRQSIFKMAMEDLGVLAFTVIGIGWFVMLLQLISYFCFK